MSTASLPPADAEAIAREFKEFAYIVSHDFSAPVRGINGFAKLLQEEYGHTLDDEARLYISMITESGEKLQNMLTGLLEYSRLSTTAKPAVDVDCNVIATQCIQSLKDTIAANNGTIEITSALPVVFANEEHIARLFSALLENALKFHATDTGAHVTISAQQQEGKWLFAIEDSGIGIEEEFYPRIFLPFKRLHTDQEYGGVGMGLPIAKKITELYGGTLWVESVPEKSSCFKFTIPSRD